MLLSHAISLQALRGTCTASRLSDFVHRVPLRNRSGHQRISPDVQTGCISCCSGDGKFGGPIWWNTPVDDADVEAEASGLQLRSQWAQPVWPSFQTRDERFPETTKPLADCHATTLIGSEACALSSTACRCYIWPRRICMRMSKRRGGDAHATLCTDTAGRVTGFKPHVQNAAVVSRSQP